MNVGDRVIWLGKTGEVQYIVTPTTHGHDVMLILDKPFPEGHNGNGGCSMYNLPRLPEFEGRCYWVYSNKLKVLKSAVIATATGSVEL